MHSSAILGKAKEDHLDHDGGGWSLLSEVKSLKPNSKKTVRLKFTQIIWPDGRSV